MRTPLVAGNWKLNGSRESVVALAREVAGTQVSGVDVVVCPVSVHMADVAGALDNTTVKPVSYTHLTLPTIYSV